MSITQKCIPGVIGGMGPQATVDFMAKLVAMTPADCDQDHIQMLVDHNPRVPNRHRAIAGDGAEVKRALATMARGLENAGADFLLMVCNTAHAFQRDIEAAIEIPFISVVDEVLAELDEQWPEVARVGVMAADGALAAGLYQDALEVGGREPVTWSKRELDQFMALVYRVKAGDSPVEIRPQMEQLAALLIERGAEVLIAGCTEIPLVMTATAADTDIAPIPMLSSTDILVARTIDYALGARSLPAP